MERLINDIFDISCDQEGKTPLQMTVKCMEELGEVAEAVLSYEQAPACAYKGKTLEDIQEESVDVFLVIVALMAKIGMEPDTLRLIAREKMVKWQNNLKMRG